MNTPSIRFGTNLITFYNSDYWSLGHELKHQAWSTAFGSDPLQYFLKMFDGVRDAGLEGVELAPDPAGWTAALDAFGTTDAMTAALAQRGLTLTSSYASGRDILGPAMVSADAQPAADDFMRRHAQFLSEMEADTIVLGNIARVQFATDPDGPAPTAEDFDAPVDPQLRQQFADQLNHVGEIIRPYGVKFAIHTDAYSICCRPDDIAALLAITDPDTVTLCPDAGHITLDGGDAVKVLEQHIDRIPTMHWKDCAAPLPGQLLRGGPKDRHDVMLKNFRVLGDGLVDWATWMGILRDNAWRGWAIEEIDMSPAPVGELRQGLEYFRAHLAEIYR